MKPDFDFGDDQKVGEKPPTPGGTPPGGGSPEKDARRTVDIDGDLEEAYKKLQDHQDSGEIKQLLARVYNELRAVPPRGRTASPAVRWKYSFLLDWQQAVQISTRLSTDSPSSVAAFKIGNVQGLLTTRTSSLDVLGFAFQSRGSRVSNYSIGPVFQCRYQANLSLGMGPQEEAIIVNCGSHVALKRGETTTEVAVQPVTILATEPEGNDTEIHSTMPGRHRRYPLPYKHPFKEVALSPDLTSLIICIDNVQNLWFTYQSELPPSKPDWLQQAWLAIPPPNQQTRAIKFVRDANHWLVVLPKEVQLYQNDPSVRELRRTRSGYTGGELLALSGNGVRIATADRRDDKVRLYEAQVSKDLPPKLVLLPPVIPGLPGEISALGLSSQGQMLAVGCDDGSVRLWDIATSTQMVQLPDPDPPIRPTQLVFGPGDAFLAAVGDDPKGTGSSQVVFWKLPGPLSGPEIK
jgi:WD40 repeat protein